MSMDQFFHGGSDSILLGLIAVIAFFFKYKLAQVDKGLDTIKSAEEILALVNGKYVSRRESDLMVEQRNELKDQMFARLEKSDMEIMMLREKSLELSGMAIQAMSSKVRR